MRLQLCMRSMYSHSIGNGVTPAQKSPIYTQKSPTLTQQSPVYIRTLHIYTLYSRRRAVYIHTLQGTASPACRADATFQTGKTCEKIQSLSGHCGAYGGVLHASVYPSGFVYVVIYMHRLCGNTHALFTMRCVRVFVYIYTCIYIYVYIYIYIYVCLCTEVFVCVHVRACVCTPVWLRLCGDVYASRMMRYVYNCFCVFICRGFMQQCIYIYMYICITT